MSLIAPTSATTAIDMNAPPPIFNGGAHKNLLPLLTSRKRVQNHNRQHTHAVPYTGGPPPAHAHNQGQMYFHAPNPMQLFQAPPPHHAMRFPPPPMQSQGHFQGYRPTVTQFHNKRPAYNPPPQRPPTKAGRYPSSQVAGASSSSAAGPFSAAGPSFAAGPSSAADPSSAAGPSATYGLASAEEHANKLLQQSPSKPRHPNTPGSATSVGFLPEVKKEPTSEYKTVLDVPPWHFPQKGLEKICGFCLAQCSKPPSSSVHFHIQVTQCPWISANFEPVPSNASTNCGMESCQTKFTYSKELNFKMIKHSRYYHDRFSKCIFCEKLVRLSNFQSHLINESYDHFLNSAITCQKCNTPQSTPASFFNHLVNSHQVKRPNRFDFNRFLPDSLTEKRNMLLFALIYYKYVEHETIVLD